MADILSYRKSVTSKVIYSVILHLKILLLGVTSITPTKNENIHLLWMYYTFVNTHIYIYVIWCSSFRISMAVLNATWCSRCGWRYCLLRTAAGTGSGLLSRVNFNLTRINNYINGNVWDEIIYPFPNFNGCTVEVWKWISNFIPHLNERMIIYPCWD